MNVKPQLAGNPWRPLFTPQATGCYVNDHTVVRARDGRWHVIGITKTTPEMNADAERYFCHGSGPSLVAGQFTEHWKVCDFGYRAWAPAVVFDGQRYVMLFGPGLLRAAVCSDDSLDVWHEVTCSVAGGAPEANLRDQMVVRLDTDTWLMYATALREGRGAISVFVSEDLLHWRFVRYAWQTAASLARQPPWCAAESPFMFRHGGAYFLSVTYTTSVDGPDDYHNTLVFRSTNPFDFGTYGGAAGEEFAKLRLHAPEYVHDPDSGQWYVTTCGWPGDTFQPAIPGSVAITELAWVDYLSCVGA
jgi:arabinan endo-1,5-alpha-L-arabinosidase